MAGLVPDSPFTDDTQMALFTAEGLIRARARARTTGTGGVVCPVARAYWRWWWTQTGETHENAAPYLDGWLAHDRRLHGRRGPGKTCVSALATGRCGTTQEPINGSKGSGAVMRAAPVGLVFFAERAFEGQGGESAALGRGCEIGALTHGHPDGWGPSGALAHLVSLLVQEVPLADAVARTLPVATGNTNRLLREAVELAAGGSVSAETLERELGGGWTGDETLAIAAACALAHEGDPEKALLTSVNHSGDSDSAGAVCGNILGASHGGQAIAPRWAQAVRDLDLVKLVAEDLLLEIAHPPTEESDGQRIAPRWWRARYP